MNSYWSLLSTHGVVLCFVATHADARVRHIAAETGLTERRVLQILCELRSAGYLLSERIGRRNHYIVPSETRFRHPVIGDVAFQAFLEAIDRSRVDSGCAGAANRDLSSPGEAPARAREDLASWNVGARN